MDAIGKSASQLKQRQKKQLGRMSQMSLLINERYFALGVQLGNIRDRGLYYESIITIDFGKRPARGLNPMDLLNSRTIQGGSQVRCSSKKLSNCRIGKRRPTLKLL